MNIGRRLYIREEDMDIHMEVVTWATDKSAHTALMVGIMQKMYNHYDNFITLNTWHTV